MNIRFIRKIPETKNYYKAILLSENWAESKFHVIVKGDKDYLLIIYSSNTIDINKTSIHQLLLERRIPTNQIINYGMIEGYHLFYILFEWLPGNNLKSSILNYSSEIQYKLGVDAGKLLKTIHSIKTSKCETKGKQLVDRVDNAIYNYENDNYNTTYPLASSYIEYLKQSIIQEDDVCVLLHGDYSLSNLLIDKNNHLFVIDWVYGSFGNPAEDFVRNLVNAETSHDFAYGLIVGYFNGIIPKSFWRLLKLYTAIHQIELLDLSKQRFENDEYINKTHLFAYQQYKKLKLLIPDYYLSRRYNHEC